jgi:hypothetical protein
MKKIARWRYFAATCMFAFSMTLSPLANAAIQDEAQELEDWQRSELQKLVEVVSGTIIGNIVHTDNPFTVAPDFLKGTDNLTYVPYRVTLDPSQLSGSSVAGYLFVIPHTDDVDAELELDDRNLPEATFEDAYFIDLSDAPDGEPIQLSRAFTAGGGVFDVYVAISESLGEDADDGDREEVVVMMSKTQVEVPDFWNGELQTSSILMAAAIEPLASPLSPEEQTENPYTLGTTRITPKTDENYTQNDELSLIMLVYNAGSTRDEKPDLTIEYNFHKRNADGEEEYFNQTSPQAFNSQTLPPGFDMSAGHQIVAGQSVPLGSFPVADYRLEILITDNEGGSNLTQNVNFSILDE